MQKKNKRSARTNHLHNRTLIDAPDLVDMDTLSYASDSELETRYRYISDEKEKALSLGVSPYLWEVEQAYLQREFKIRSSRRIMHEAYVRNNPDLETRDFEDEVVLNEAN